MAELQWYMDEKDERRRRPPIQIQKAYGDDEFLGSSTARPLRILAEFMEPKDRFAHEQIENTVVFFGSARILPTVDAIAPNTMN